MASGIDFIARRPSIFGYLDAVEFPNIDLTLTRAVQIPSSVPSDLSGSHFDPRRGQAGSEYPIPALTEVTN
jgi:hypothetical protein